MIETTAAVPTTNAGKYILSLCKRLHDRIDVNFHQRQCVIHFENALATLTPHKDQLMVTIIAHTVPDVEHLQTVVADHLNSVASRGAPLRFDWRRSSNFALHAL